MRLIIAEKPSVARDLARVLGANNKRQGYIEGNGLKISWCFGHMAELDEPHSYNPEWKSWSLRSLPMVPDGFKVKIRDGARDQFKVLERLLHDPQIEEVVNACDAGREGELIFRYVVQLAGCSKPMLRLWVSSLTDEAIQQGWGRLRPSGEYDALADAARSRSEADWLVGLNATRALTCAAKNAGVLSVGRVQTPTLAMIVARDLEIADFVAQPFWQVQADFEAEQGSWTASWVRAEAARSKQASKDNDDEAPHAERLDSEADAKLLVAAVKGRQGQVATADRRQTREQPPLLYDLTALQRRANQRYGYSAQKTLDLAQALYERHKLITYPRTDARYLTPDQVSGLAAVVQTLGNVPPYAVASQDVLSRPIQPGKRVVNAAEVGDHHAILPTTRSPIGVALSADEKRVYDLVARRMLAALSEDALFDVTLLLVEVPTEGELPEGIASPVVFRARGRICRKQGWRAIDPPSSKTSKTPEFPPVEAGDAAVVKKVKVKKGETRPPKPYTDASILGAMETAGKQLDDAELKRAMRSRGLGTPATRAAILQTLIARKYIERAGKALRATDRGISVIRALTVDELKSAELTGRWEGRLQDMAEGKFRREAFMQAVVEYTGRIVQTIASHPPEGLEAVPSKWEKQRPIGTCPECGEPVRPRGKVFSCDTGRDCTFVVFGTIARRTISAKMVRAMLKDGKSEVVKGFKSKAGKEFSAAIRWDSEAKKVTFDFPPRSVVRPGAPCPKCQRGKVIAGRTRLGCSEWRAGCDFAAPFPVSGR